MNGADPGRKALIPLFHQKEGHAVDDQGNGHHHKIVKMGVHPVVQQQADHRRRHHRGNDLEPELPGLFFALRALFGGEGVQLMEKQDNDRQDRPHLDYHLEHLHEGVGHVQLHKLVQQDQMARRGYRQPFRDSLHNAE